MDIVRVSSAGRAGLLIVNAGLQKCEGTIGWDLEVQGKLFMFWKKLHRYNSSAYVRELEEAPVVGELMLRSRVDI